MQTSKLFKIAIVIAAVIPVLALTACKQEIECEHWWEEVTIRATCITEGHRQVRCAVCREISWDEETPIIPSAHDVALWEITRQVEMCSDGLEEGICSLCENNISRSIEAPHNYGSLTTVRAATCLFGGSSTVSCINCRAIKTYFSPALGHSWKKNQY